MEKSAVETVKAAQEGGTNILITYFTMPEPDVRTDGFTVSRDPVSEAEADIVRWVQSLGF